MIAVTFRSRAGLPLSSAAAAAAVAAMTAVIAMTAVVATVVIATVVIATAAVVAPAVCHADPRTTLYERLGGEAGVAAISNDLIDRVAGDPRIGGSFKDTDLAHIKKMLTEQICELSGGPCRYSGDPMKETHAGHHISEAEFYGMVAELRDILHERHVSLGATNELLRLLAPMKRDVVEHASTDTR